MTTSLCLHFPSTKLTKSIKNPIISWRSPSYFKSVPPLSNSSYLSSSILRCQNDQDALEKSLVDKKDWEKWMEHCDHIDHQNKLLSELQSQYTHAIDKGDYKNVARLQVAITEATKDDAVGIVMSNLDKAVEEERFEDAILLRDTTAAGLVGWWTGISDDPEFPYGQIIHVSREHGRFLAKSYSAWQLATAKDGTPLFEIYVSTSKDGNYKEKAMYLMRKGAPRCYIMTKKIDVSISHLAPNPSRDLWAETLWRYFVAIGMDYTREEFEEMFEENGMGMKMEDDELAREQEKFSGENKAVITNLFAIGDIVDYAKEKLTYESLRLPASLDRKACFSFSLCMDINYEYVYGEGSPKDYRTLDHAILDHVDCIGRGILKEGEGHDKLWPFVLTQAKNQQPQLSKSTTFNRLDVSASPDPLNGLYIGSNSYIATEVIQLRRKFGHWHEDGGIDDVSKLEPCDYVEVVKLTGDFDVPAGEIAFRAKVGKNYKLPPWYTLKKSYGAVARYKGQGRLTGFQKSGWVDVELFILEGLYREDGFAIGFLYSAPEYYYWKLYKKLILPSSGVF